MRRSRSGLLKLPRGCSLETTFRRAHFAMAEALVAPVHKTRDTELTAVGCIDGSVDRYIYRIKGRH